MSMKMTSRVKLTTDCLINWRESPHMLVSGVTGSTKSNTLEDTLLRCMSTKTGLDHSLGMCAKAYVIDGKGGDLATLKSLHPAISPNQAAKMLRILDANMYERYSHFSGEFGKTAADYLDDNGRSVRQVIVVIDELSVLLNDPKTRAEIQRYLFDLLTAARQASIYVSPLCRGKSSCWNSAPFGRNIA